MTDTTEVPVGATSPSPTSPPAAPPSPAPPPSPRPAAGATRRPRHRLRLILVFAVLIGAVVFLLVEGLGSSLDYFDTVDQALAHKATLGTTTFRLEGTVVQDSIRPTASGADFVVSGGHGKTVVVHNTGSPPQLFQTGIPVVVDGHFASRSSDLFLSNQIEVKHSATYVAAHPTRVKSRTGKKSDP